MTKTKCKKPLIIAVVVVAAVLGYAALTMRDQRSIFGKVSDAVQALPQGADKATEQLEDRTPAQKIDDAVKDSTTP